jgi:SagB-type dehydrogenase family enzyme
VSGDPRVTSGRIEIYATIDACVDLPAGLYRYVAADHGLENLDSRAADREALQRQAMRCAELERPPQVLLTLVAPHDGASAYAGVLRDAGAVYQTMYLVATAQGIAACALGTGDAELFARASGCDALALPSVGEFVIGSPP